MPLDRLRHDYAAHGSRLGDEVSTGLLLPLGTVVPRCQSSTHERSVHGLRAALLLDGDQFEAGVLLALVQQIEGLAVAMTGRPRVLFAPRTCRLGRRRGPDRTNTRDRREGEGKNVPDSLIVTGGKNLERHDTAELFHCTFSAGVRRSGWDDG